MTTFKKESSGNTHGTLFTTVQKQKKNMERSLYGKLSAISLEAV